MARYPLTSVLFILILIIDFQVGGREDSAVYIRMKIKAGQEVYTCIHTYIHTRTSHHHMTSATLLTIYLLAWILGTKS